MTELTHEQKPGWLSRPLWATMNLDWEKGIYLAFILIAIVSRFWGLGDRVMSHDESLHTQFSYQFYNGEGYNHTPLMHGPFLFHITAVSYWLLGDSDFSARVPVALFGVVLVVLPYLLRRWLGRVGALFASFFFLISPYITYYSRYIRHDIYVIVWAMMVFIAIMYYLHDRQEKYLWWFAAGTALMFATKEVSFIYVAIFGSYLIIRLWPQMVAAPWFKRVLPRLRAPILLVGVGVLLLGAGLIGKEVVTTPTETAVSTTTAQGFAADPNQATVGDTTETADGRALPFRILQLVGVGVLSAGLFLAVREMRPHIDQYPEFDLITLFTTLVLPTVSPLLVTMAGWNPRDYGINKCLLEGQESMSSLQLFLARMTNSVCISSFLNSGMVRSGFFLLLTLAVAVLVGLWWHNRRWLIAAGIFHAIFAVLYTSVFTNPGGWASGMIGSLGYWLEQQGVQRGSQPGFYYFFVVPFYEFLPVLFSLAAIWLWSKQHQLNKIAGYWLGLILSSLLLFSLTNWLFNRSAVAAGAETTAVPGVIFALLLFFLGVLYWFFVRRGQLLAEYGLRRNFNGLFKRELVCETVPFLTWWLALTWVAYTVAGEKMPWLSTHFVIPMGLLGGWYFAERLRPFSWRDLLNRTTAVFFGLTVALFVALFLTIAPLWLGQVQLGNQQLNNLRGIGRFLGGLLTTGIIFYFWRDWQAKIGRSLRNFTLIFSLFTLLAILTIRFTYLASFPNADYSIEFLNYAHGAPATKEAVLAQVEELSMRLYGDKSIKVAFDNDSSWPFTWYLRDYPNRLYFGENPSNAITDAPVIIVGSLNWGKVEPFLGDNYTQQTFTFLWWPMEEYRKFSWNAIFGTPENGRGLGNPGVRQALWDIFFYRDYTRYGEVFGGNYSIGQWPLRHELRLYIRKDVLANLWDYGVGAVQAEGLTDPYAENVLTLSPVMVLNESGLPGTDAGQFSAPRNVAVGPDGRIYVADSGNHRIQVFDANGNFVTMWGQFGVGPGEFNEPWGLAVDDQFVYVADTWNNRIQKFTLDGDYVAEFGTSGVGNGEGTLGLFYGPRDVLLLSDNRLLVTDTGNHRLQILDRDGNFLLELGGQGSLPGQFFEPVGLGLAANGDILVADTWNGRVQEITPDLVPVNTWRVEGWRSQSVNNKPYLAVDSNGRIYITDPENYRVIIFSPTGNYLARFGQFGNDTNSFGLPNGIAIDKQDNIYIADAVNNRILKFAPIFGQATSDTEENTLEDEAISEPVEQNGETGETGETEEERGDAEERGGETAVDDNAPTPSPTP